MGSYEAIEVNMYHLNENVGYIPLHAPEVDCVLRSAVKSSYLSRIKA